MDLVHDTMLRQPRSHIKTSVLETI